MIERTLTPPQPFSLRSTLSPIGVATFDSDGVAWVPWASEGGPATAAIDPNGSKVRGWGPGAAALLDRVPRLLGFDDDPRDFDPGPGLLRDLHRRNRGLRLGSTGGVWNALLSGILGQLVTRKESKQSLRRLYRAYGEAAPGPYPDLLITPRPDRIASLGYEDLHGHGIERKRASVLIEAARRSKRLEEIIDLPPEAARKRLVAVRGVGPWTAEGVMGDAYGDRDAVRTGDYHLPNMVAWALAGEARATDERMLELLEPYRPQRRRALLLIKVAGIHAPRYGPKSAVRSIEHI